MGSDEEEGEDPGVAEARHGPPEGSAAPHRRMGRPPGAARGSAGPGPVGGGGAGDGGTGGAGGAAAAASLAGDIAQAGGRRRGAVPGGAGLRGLPRGPPARQERAGGRARRGQHQRGAARAAPGGREGGGGAAGGADAGGRGAARGEESGRRRSRPGAALVRGEGEVPQGRGGVPCDRLPLRREPGGGVAPAGGEREGPRGGRHARRRHGAGARDGWRRARGEDCVEALFPPFAPAAECCLPTPACIDRPD